MQNFLMFAVSRVWAGEPVARMSACDMRGCRRRISLSLIRATDCGCSVACIADVAVEADIDLPCPALSLHKIGQHRLVALDHGFDVLAQHPHELRHLLAQSALV